MLYLIKSSGYKEKEGKRSDLLQNFNRKNDE